MGVHEKPAPSPPTAAAAARPALRSFGLTFAVVFTLFGVYFWWRARVDVSRGFWIAAGLFALVALATPGLLSPLHAPWMKFAEVLGRINTKLLLGLFYFVGMTPLGRLMRLFGNDPMARRAKPAGESYWIRSSPPASGRRHFENQF